MSKMTKKELIEALATDPVLRAKFMASAIRFYEDLGVEITPEDVERIESQALKNLANRLGTDSSLPIFVWPTILGNVSTSDPER